MSDIASTSVISRQLSESSSTTIVKAKTKRVEWPDIARGIGIILVVIGHAIGGMITGQTIAVGSALYDVYYFIYTFHMPLFFFLSGLFIVERLQTQRDRFLGRAVTTIAYPYLLWSITQLTVIAMMGSLVNVPVTLSPRVLTSVLWWPPSQFWFLYVLFLLQVVSRFAVPAIGATGLLMGAILLRGVADSADLPKALDMTFRFAIFYAIGAAFGPAIVSRLPRIRAEVAVAGIGLATLAWLALSELSLRLDGNYLSAFAIPAAIAGGAAMVLLASRLDGSRASEWLIWLGRRSMAIYVLHVLFVAGTRIALKVVGVATPGLVLPIAVLIGIVGPLIVYEMARRFKLQRALGLG